MVVMGMAALGCPHDRRLKIQHRLAQKAVSLALAIQVKSIAYTRRNTNHLSMTDCTHSAE